MRDVMCDVFKTSQKMSLKAVLCLIRHQISRSHFVAKILARFEAELLYLFAGPLTLRRSKRCSDRPGSTRALPRLASAPAGAAPMLTHRWPRGAAAAAAVVPPLLRRNGWARLGCGGDGSAVVRSLWSNEWQTRMNFPFARHEALIGLVSKLLKNQEVVPNTTLFYF